MKNPHRHTHIALQHTGTGLQVTVPLGETIQFDGIDAIVLQAADGSNSIDAILAIVRNEANPSATRETIFASLDRLADASLLQSRVAPPADGNRTSRRDMLRLVGATAACAVMVPAGAAFGADSSLASEGLRKALRDAEKKAKELSAAESDAKIAWREAEEIVRDERRDVYEAVRQVNIAERDLSAAEKEDKGQQSPASEQSVKRAQGNLDAANRVAEEEAKEFAVADARAAEAKEKAFQTRVSEEVAKKTDKSEEARARREGSPNELMAKAEENLAKGHP